MITVMRTRSLTSTGLFIAWFVFFFQAEDGIRDLTVTGVQTCALPISSGWRDAVSTRRPWPARSRRASGAGASGGRRRRPASLPQAAEGTDRPLRSGAGRAEAAGAALARGELVRLDRLGALNALEDELGDALAAPERHRRLGVVVDEQHFQLTAVARIDQSGRVEDRHAPLQGEPRAGQHEPGVPRGHGDGEPRPDERPATRRQRDVVRGAEVEPGVAVARVGRQGNGRIEPLHTDPDHGTRTTLP